MATMDIHNDDIYVHQLYQYSFINTKRLKVFSY